MKKKINNRPLKFITGNDGKFKEQSAIFLPIKIKRVNIDLDEIQEVDPYKIILHKLKEAFKHESKNFFIEDTSCSYRALKNKLPGPYMKSFLVTLGTMGLYNMAKKLGDTRATMLTVIAYVKDKKHIFFFEGSTTGNIVKPKGSGGFGVDKVFMPKGSNKTMAQIKESGITKFSPRFKAAMKLKAFLLK